MARQSAFSDDMLSSDAAVSEVWGPSRSWLALASILVGGAAGWGIAVALPDAAEVATASRDWAGPLAWMGYGLAIGGIVTLLPRVVSLLMLGRSLTQRPAADGGARSWWPLPLLAAALRETPSLRRTPEDFRLGVSGFVSQARSLLAQRLWPACVAAFATPVFGLISAWMSWESQLPEAIRRSQEQVQDGDAAAVVPSFDWGIAAPMIISIGLASLLMLGIVVVDQLARRLLLRWAATVRMLDAESPLVQERLAPSGEAPPRRVAGDKPPQGSQASRATPSPEVAVVPPPPPPPPKPEPRISAEELEGLGDLFKNG